MLVVMVVQAVVQVVVIQTDRQEQQIRVMVAEMQNIMVIHNMAVVVVVVLPQ